MIVKKIRRGRLERKAEREKRFLCKNVDIMPARYKKFIASYYPDANVRKKYLEDIGVEFQENSFANIGFVKIPNTNAREKVVIGKNVLSFSTICATVLAF